MINYMLEHLELPPGASENEVRESFRRLSRKFHPDYGHQKLIDIYASFYALQEIGPDPEGASMNYDYDPDDPEYADVIHTAYRKAHRRLDSTIFVHQGFLRGFYSTLKILGLIIVSLNLILIADISFQSYSEPAEIIDVRLLRRDPTSVRTDDRFYQVDFKDGKSLKVTNLREGMHLSTASVLTVSPILGKVRNFTITYDDENITDVVEPFESVYSMHLFYWLIGIVLVLYGLAWIVNDFVLNKLTLNLVFIMAFVLELSMFILY